MTSVLTRQKRDHTELDRLLHEIDAASDADRQHALNRLCRLVFPHAFAEESVLWPVVRRVLPDGADLTLAIEQEHQQINELFTQLEMHPPHSAEHRRLWSQIVPLLREDVRDEEDVLFPKLAAALSARQLAALGLAWEAVRRTAPTRAHPVVARRPPGNVLAAAPLTVIDRLRDRLDRTAQSGSGAHVVLTKRLSGGLARVAGLIEHTPPLTHGEHPSTATPR